MTAELWLVKPCEKHGMNCSRLPRVRLDPDRVVFKAQVPVWEDVTVEDIIDALTEQETDQ